MLDIKGEFDTIKQDKLVEILNTYLRDDRYMVQRFVVISDQLSKIRKKFCKKANSYREYQHFHDFATSFAEKMKNSVFVDQAAYQNEDRATVLLLMEEHIKSNLVKV
jgi:telomerase reverse transcriptase